MKGTIQAFNNVALETIWTPEPKMFWKREGNGVSTPHVKSMRPYAHIQAKQTKKGLLVKTCNFTLLGT